LSVGYAFTLKSLIMPGRVHEAHAAIEDDCDRCHEKTEAESQNELCFTCHVEVRNDVAQRNGFHGRNPKVNAGLCSNCHEEHEGRNANISGLELPLFAHEYTDFPLAGAHSNVDCAACHVPEAEFRDAPSECATCHASDDVHMGVFESSCAECHSETAWARTRFEHADTRFPLVGKHADAVCSNCHEDRSFVGAPTECIACHRIEDRHRGRNGEQCENCHTPNAWPVARFDHVGVSGFALSGSHRQLSCESCHVENLTVALPATCAGCHRQHDVHRGVLGESCDDCHGTTQWRDSSFNHVAASAFALLGAHADLQCTSCHRSGVDASLGRECSACHTEDPHQGQLGAQCADCHSEFSWSGVAFDHDFAAFPLLGRHAATTCGSCHASLAFHSASAECHDCHVEEDVHDGHFGQECDTCHNPADWRAWIFDHDLQTNFALTGAHDDLACTQCHRRPATELGTPSRTCAQCHRGDDPHLGRFGADCGSCHSTQSFLELRSP
jgi:hypothetical protein